jgi:hypothetical protein
MRAYFLPARSMSPVSGFAVILPGIGDTFLHSFFCIPAIAAFVDARFFPHGSSVHDEGRQRFPEPKAAGAFS